MSDTGDLYIQAAEKDFAEKLSGDMTKIRVPEMDTGEGEAKKECHLYFKPSTLAERDLIYRAVQNGGLDSLTQIIIVRARDEDKKRLFGNKHKTFFDRLIDPDVTVRIVKELGEAEGIDLEDEDAEKKPLS